jgi:spore germination cell wall hydrolase CwlJ-like protein
MISKIRAAGVAAAVFACAGAALIGGPVQAWEGTVAIPGVPAAFGLAGPALDSDAAPDASSLDALVAQNAGEDTADAEQDCLANAVYFEARGESLQGQLAVAEVVMNRAASGRYPTSLCAVVVQPAQFSFVRHGHIPHADRASEAWRRAVGVARVAAERIAPRLLPSSCLWYHANYVSPSWGRRLAETTRIGLHIFYS